MKCLGAGGEVGGRALSLNVRPQEALPTGGTRGSRQTVGEAETPVCVCVPVQEAAGESEDPKPAARGIVHLNTVTGEVHSLSVRVCVTEGVVPATGVGLRPQELICPGARSCGDWSPGASYHIH